MFVKKCFFFKYLLGIIYLWRLLQVLVYLYFVITSKFRQPHSKNLEIVRLLVGIMDGRISTLKNHSGALSVC